jgi:hypothetical protein
VPVETVLLRGRQESLRLIIQLAVEARAHVRFGSQLRAALCSANEREMDTRFAVLGPDDLVLEMVQRHDSPAETPDQLPPRGAGKGANITNVLQRVVIGDQAKGAGIVKSGRAPYMDWDSSEFQAFPVRR